MSEQQQMEEKPLGRIEQGFFSYKDVQDAELAVSEKDRIGRLERQLDYSKPKLVLALYTKAVTEGVFRTPEGYMYLIKLRAFLEDKKEELGAEIPSIPAEFIIGEDENEALVLQLKNRLKEGQLKLKNEKSRRVGLYIVIAFLAAALVAMLVIAGFSDSPNILNYERVLQDRYADWEQDLKERESVLREKELELKRE
ncbi:MAG: hypothetical protein IK115_11745 [Lachnospiraceae bacterium]|nr:hypothetical protein [Lachnospiraceae bacterium]